MDKKAKQDDNTEETETVDGITVFSDGEDPCEKASTAADQKSVSCFKELQENLVCVPFSGNEDQRTNLSQQQLLQLLLESEKREQLLREEKQERDEEYGRHRAIFKQICVQKEGLVGQVQQEFDLALKEFLEMRENYSAVQAELGELRSVAAFAENSSKNELDIMRQRYALEMESMEQAMRATIDDSIQDAEQRWQTERRQHLEALGRLKQENEDLKRKIHSSPDRGSLLATLSRKVSASPAFSLPSSASLYSLNSAPLKEDSNYSRDMQKAKNDADILKSIVLPLEDEISALKSQLQEATEKLEYYEKEKLQINSVSSNSVDALSKKFGTKEFDLSTASKSDVEMYLGVLQTQKVVLQDDAVTSRKELVKMQKLLEREKGLVQYYRRRLSSAQMNMASHPSEDSLDHTRSDNVSLRSIDTGDDSALSQPSDPSLINLCYSGEFDFIPLNLDDQNSKPGATGSSLPASSPGPCVMCTNYESQLQAAQTTENRLRAELLAAERNIERLKDDLKREHQFRDEMDRKLAASVADTQAQISELFKSQADAEKLLGESRTSGQEARLTLEQTVRDMCLQRENTSKELNFLQSENDKLIDRYSQHSRAMQEEIIDLPNNIEELHHILLKYREDVIKSRVAKEHIEDNLRSENMFLKDQLHGEQQNKDSMVDMLSREIDALRERIAILESEKMDLEGRLKEVTDKHLEETLSEQQKQEGLLKAQLTNLSNDKEKLEKDLHHCRSKAQALQIELDNSETVQRDFVKLSQSLQVELEKIRQAENEVRWQFDEDVDECNGCNQPFLLSKKKVRSLKIHCRHCGKIFCHDCLSKDAPSGPNRRAAKVCDVCHTILNRDTAPYFSYSPPSTK